MTQIILKVSYRGVLRVLGWTLASEFSVWFEDKIAADNDVEAPSGPHFEGWLYIKAAVNDPLASNIGAVLATVLQGAGQAVTIITGKLGANAQQ